MMGLFSAALFAILLSRKLEKPVSGGTLIEFGNYFCSLHDSISISALCGFRYADGVFLRKTTGFPVRCAQLFPGVGAWAAEGNSN